MKGKKLFAVILAALMTVSSVGVTSFAEENNAAEENDIMLVNESSLDNATIGDVEACINEDKSAEGFSIYFGNITLTKDVEVELYHDTTLLSTTSVKPNSKHIGNTGFSCFIAWGGDINESNTWKTVLNADAVDAEELPNKIIVYTNDENKTFDDFTVRNANKTYENFTVFKTPTLPWIDPLPDGDYKSDAEAISIAFENLGRVCSDMRVELYSNNTLLATTTPKAKIIGDENPTVAVICGGNADASSSWKTVLAENDWLGLTPNKVVLFNNGKTHTFENVALGGGAEKFEKLDIAEDTFKSTAIKDATVSRNGNNNAEGFSITFTDIKLREDLSIELCYDDTVLSTTTVRENSENKNKDFSEISCFIAWGGKIDDSSTWQTVLNAKKVDSAKMPNKVIVKANNRTKVFENIDILSPVGDAYEDLTVFKTPTLNIVEYMQNYKNAQGASISMNDIGRVHKNMTVELMSGNVVLAVATPKDKIIGTRTENDELSALIITSGDENVSGSWKTELKETNWARLAPDTVRVTNNGIVTTMPITTVQGSSYDELDIASKAITFVKAEVEDNMKEGEYSSNSILLTLDNVGRVENSMSVELYHDNTLLSTTNASEKRLHSSNSGITVNIICGGDPEVSDSWSTEVTDAWSLDALPNKAVVTIDGVETQLAIDEIVPIEKLVKFDVFSRSIDVSVEKNEVEADDTFTVTVTLNGKNMANVSYDLSYETDKFELVAGAESSLVKDTKNGCIKELYYQTDDAVFADKQTWTYTFKALAQTQEVTGSFNVSNMEAYTWDESYNGLYPETLTNGNQDVTILLKKYETTVKVDGIETDKTEVKVPYTNDGHTVEVISNPEAKIKYSVNDGEMQESLKLTERGTYEIKYTSEDERGYEKISGTFTLIIGDPDYLVEVNLNQVEGADYVDGKKIVLVYTDADNLSFNYNEHLMIEVTKQQPKYQYVGTKSTKTDFKHVFAFVTDAIENGTLEDYEAKVTCDIPQDNKLEVLQYAMDINCDTRLNAQDISTIYGIFNVRKTWFGAEIKEQKKLLRADTNGNKYVDSSDTNAVVAAVKSEIAK